MYMHVYTHVHVHVYTVYNKSDDITHVQVTSRPRESDSSDYGLTDGMSLC